MQPIDDYLGGATYDPEAVKCMSAALDLVLRELHDKGQPKVVREVLAKRIVELAAIGERDVKQLCKTVLSEVGLHPGTPLFGSTGEPKAAAE